MLTDQTIKAMQPPEKGYHILWDGKLAGFGCRISHAGTRAFVVLVASGRPKTLGRYPLLSLADARREAHQLLAHKTLGKVHPARTPFVEAVDAFLTDCRTRIRPRTFKDYTRLLKHLQFGRTAIADITARDILNQLKGLTSYERYHAFTIGRTFFRWCIRQHYIDRSPTENMAIPYNRRPRERVLIPDEIKALWKATQSLSPYHTIVRLLLLTGQRRGEITCMQWDWINQDERLICIPPEASKNGRGHVFPYGDEVQAILKQTPRYVDSDASSGLLFPAARIRSDKATCFNGWGKAKAALDQASGATGYVLHDLRRTYSSTMAALGVPQVVVEKLLNHVSGGTLSPIAAVYNRHAYMNEMREAVLRYEAYLTTLIAPTA